MAVDTLCVTSLLCVLLLIDSLVAACYRQLRVMWVLSLRVHHVL